MRVFFKAFSIVAVSLALFACGPSDAEKAAGRLTIETKLAERSIEDLAVHLKQGRITNALILKTYADILGSSNPELASLAKALSSNADIDGPAYQGLLNRLGESKKITGTFAKKTGDIHSLFVQQQNELQSIDQAANAANFNLMLADPINVLAGLSKGALSKVSNGVPDKAGADAIPGSELVGNPNYGEWKQSSNGSSFWAFYGQYAFFSSLFSGPVSYGGWSNNRTPSYYSDRGRHHYTSKQQASNLKAANTRERKKFQSEGKAFKSPYAKNKGSKVSVNRSSLKSPSKFQSGYASKSSSSSRNNSFTSSFNKRASSSSFNSSYQSRSSSSSRSFRSGGK